MNLSLHALNLCGATSTLATVLAFIGYTGVASMYGLMCYAGWFVVCLQLTHTYFRRKRWFGCLAALLSAVTIGVIVVSPVNDELDVLLSVTSLAVVQNFWAVLQVYALSTRASLP